MENTKPKPVDIISLGAGVQSSTMSLMAAAGEITPMPKAAIFADTQAEPASVYKWLDWLEKELPFPVIRVTKGNLAAVALTLKQRKTGNGLWSKTVIPTYILNKDGSRGIVQRQCTWDFKMTPIIREAKRLRKKYQASNIIQWIGISVDEVWRMKPSREKLITHRWPLVEMGFNRQRCLQWMKSMGFSRPPRSACVFCPYHNDHEWRRLKKEEPDEFYRAVQFEKDLQQVKAQTDNMNGIPFLHSSLKRLELVDLETLEEKGQLNLFNNECEGMCGV